jgi:serine/threonine protein phosphatase PrpC
MEDRYVIHLFNDIAVFGVFDGHGGTEAADFIADSIIPALRTEFQKELGERRSLLSDDSNPQPADIIETETVDVLKRSLLEAIENIENDAITHLRDRQDYSGSTLCLCLCTRNTLLCASLGDSRVYVSRNGVSKQVTRRDHLATENKEECQRIVDEGGYVNQEGYVGGRVQVTRAIGDLDPETAKKVTGLSAIPELSEYNLDLEKDEFILVACDGVWEVFSGQAAINHVRSSLKATNGDLLKAADGLVEKAIDARTSDNVTVVIAFLPAVSRIWTKQTNVNQNEDDASRPRLFLKKQSS